MTNEELKTTGLSSSVNDFKSLFDMMQGTSSKKYGKANNMTDQEKTISFLNQYFIYKKRQNVNSSEVFKMYTDESIDKPVDFTISKPVKLKERLILS